MKIELAKTEVIHFIGIGGIGMSGLYLIMNSKGFKVQGRDLNLTNNCEIQKNTGIIGDSIFAFARGLDLDQENMFEKNPEERRGKWKKILTRKNTTVLNRYNIVLKENNLILMHKNKEI